VLEAAERQRNPNRTVIRDKSGKIMGLRTGDEMMRTSIPTTPAERAALYKTKEWRAVRAHRMAKDKSCRMCLQMGIKTEAWLVDHIVPHRGDRKLFFDYQNTQVLCDTHHSGLKQRAESLGFSTAGPLTSPTPCSRVEQHHWFRQPRK
jgi:hypothetical protein